MAFKSHNQSIPNWCRIWYWAKLLLPTAATCFLSRSHDPGSPPDYLFGVVQPHLRPKMINFQIQRGPSTATPSYQLKPILAHPGSHSFQGPRKNIHNITYSLHLGWRYITGYHQHTGDNSCHGDYDLTRPFHVDVKKEQRKHHALQHPKKYEPWAGPLAPYWHWLSPASEEGGKPAQNCATHPQLPKSAPKDTTINGIKSCQEIKKNKDGCSG